MNSDNRFLYVFIALMIISVLVLCVLVPGMNGGECQAADNDHYTMRALVEAEQAQAKSLKKIADELVKIRKGLQ